MPQTVLLIDDDPEFRSLLQAILEPGGHRIFELDSVAAAQELLSEQRCDLVVIDELLVDGSGLELCAWLKEWLPGVAVVFFSSFWRDSARSDDIGPNARVLQKPVLPGELRAVLRDALWHSLPADQRDGTLVADFDGVDDILSFLRDAYRDRLDARLGELEEALSRARQEGLSSEETYRVLLLAHGLHGSAGSFGFFEVSAAVGRIELLFDQLLSNKVEDYDGFWSQLDEALLRATSGSIRPMSDFGESTGAHIGRVMVVDDDEAFVREVVEMGRRRLVDVVPAHSFSEAVSRARDQELDGVFINLALGEPEGIQEGGFELARRLRAEAVGAKLPVAFLSVEDSLQTRVAAAHAGGALFLTKPLAEASFIEATRRFAAVVHAEPIRVLTLTEDPQIGEQLAALLEHEGVDLRASEDPPRVLDMLDAFRPDLVIIDAVLAQHSGFDVCRVLRLHPDWQDLPVMLRSAESTHGHRQAAFQAGADDHIDREVRGQELLDRVLLRTQRYRRLRERLDRDPLTGLMTRSVFAELIAGRLGEASRVNRNITLALLDIDRFRQINDAHGILSGDDVLSTLGKLLTARFRIEDLRARWGGSEFAVALSGADRGDARAVLQRVQEEVAMLRFTAAAGAEFGATISVGLSTYPHDGDTVEELLSAADLNLREARTRGPQGLVSSG